MLSRSSLDQSLYNGPSRSMWTRLSRVPMFPLQRPGGASSSCRLHNVHGDFIGYRGLGHTDMLCKVQLAICRNMWIHKYRYLLVSRCCKFTCPWSIRCRNSQCGIVQQSEWLPEYSMSALRRLSQHQGSGAPRQLESDALTISMCTGYWWCGMVPRESNYCPESRTKGPDSNSRKIPYLLKIRYADTANS
jgi:hypothetical protein